jgi:hypothetical protein
MQLAVQKFLRPHNHEFPRGCGVSTPGDAIKKVKVGRAKKDDCRISHLGDGGIGRRDNHEYAQ